MNDFARDHEEEFDEEGCLPSNSCGWCSAWRWVGPFENADGSAITAGEPTKREVAGFKTTQVEAAGTYIGGMGAGTPQAAEGQAGQRMIATIVETPTGPYYFKFLGADKIVIENRKALEGLFQSMKASE